MKSIEIAKQISKDLKKDWIELLEDNNKISIFGTIYNLQLELEDKNRIICFIIYAYDNNSNWINLNADRLEDKFNILKGLNTPKDTLLYDDLVNQKISEIQDVITNYLISITNWKWRTILTCFDFHAINIKVATEPTKSTDELEAAKINKAKGELLKEAIRQREVGENLLREIKAEYVKSDRATQQDFGFEMTNEKRINPESWRDWIKQLNEKKKQTT